MHIILVAPEFPANQRNFARALREAGAYVTGIGERPVEALGDEVVACGVSPGPTDHSTAGDPREG